MGYRAELEAVRARADALAHTLAQRELEIEALTAARGEPAESKVPSTREQRLIAELDVARRELAEQKAPHARTPDPDAIRKTVFFAGAIVFVVVAAALFAGRSGHTPSHAHAAARPHVAGVEVNPAEVSCAPNVP